MSVPRSIGYGGDVVAPDEEKVPLLLSESQARYIDGNNLSPRCRRTSPVPPHNARGGRPYYQHCIYDYTEYENCPDQCDTLLSNAAFGPRDADDWYTEQLYFEKHGRPMPSSRNSTPMSSFYGLAPDARAALIGENVVPTNQMGMMHPYLHRAGSQILSTSNPQSATQALLRLELARCPSFNR